MNLSSGWPTTVRLQLLLCQYQLIVASCNLFSCNGAVVLCMCWHVTIIVAITVIVIVKVALAFGCIQWHNKVDRCIGYHIGCLLLRDKEQGRHKSAIAQGLWRRYSARSDISCVWNVTSLLLFFPTKANLWYKGWSSWWLWSQMWLSSCGTLGFQDWWQSMTTQFVTYPASIIASCDWQREWPDSALQLLVLYAHNNVSIYFFLHSMNEDRIIQWILSYILLNAVVTTLGG